MRNKIILLVFFFVILFLSVFTSAVLIDENISGLTYEGGDFDDVNCKILGSAEWLGTQWVDSCQSSASVLYIIDDYPSARVSVIIEEYGKEFDDDILVESIEDLYDWDEFDSFDYSVIMEGIHLASITNGGFKQSMLFWESGNYIVSIMVDELPMNYSDDPLVKSVLDSYLVLYPLVPEGEGVGQGTCKDSDGGKNLLVSGKAEIEEVGGKGDWCDYSKGENKIYEAYCVDNITYASVLMDCPSDNPYCSKGECSASKPQCIENDGGENPLVLGTTFPSRMADHSGATDYCQITSTGQPPESGECSGVDCSLREFFCTEGSPDEFYNDIPCPSGCKNGVCSKIEPTEETGPIDIVEETEGVKEEVKVVKDVCNGCALDNKCYPIGYRMESTYCDDQQFLDNKEANAFCNNDFECSTNLCIDNECIDSGFWRKIMGFFRNFLGLKGDDDSSIISFQEAKAIAVSKINVYYDDREWNYAGGKLLYNYEGEPVRYYFLFTPKTSNVSINDFEDLEVLIQNVSECYESGFCLSNFATISVKAYNFVTGRGDRGVVTRHYTGIPSFIADKIKLESKILSNFSDKKFGREIVFSELLDEPIYYSLIDKNAESLIEKLSKDTLIVKAWAGDFRILTISDFLEGGDDKITEEMKGAMYA
jgi:hypothetical protein